MLVAAERGINSGCRCHPDSKEILLRHRPEGIPCLPGHGPNFLAQPLGWVAIIRHPPAPQRGSNTQPPKHAKIPACPPLRRSSSATATRTRTGRTASWSPPRCPRRTGPPPDLERPEHWGRRRMVRGDPERHGHRPGGRLPGVRQFPEIEVHPPHRRSPISWTDGKTRE